MAYFYVYYGRLSNIWVLNKALVGLWEVELAVPLRPNGCGCEETLVLVVIIFILPLKNKKNNYKVTVVN